MSDSNPGRPTVIRWRILAILIALSFVSYVLRTNVTVAAKFMMPELGISKIQIGWVYAAFLWGYSLSQIPGGLFGLRFGPRRVLASITLVSGALTVLSGLVPGQLATGTFGALLSLIILQFLLGVIQAPLFPTMQGAIEAWFPPGGWAFPTGLAGAGMSFGAAFTAPLAAWVMISLGWRESFYLIAPFVLIVVVVWWWYATDSPAGHPRLNQRELELVALNRPLARGPALVKHWRLMIQDRNILNLTLSYFAMNFLFWTFFQWLFIYLVDDRGFDILTGGFAAALPWIVGGVSTVVGGRLCDRLCRSFGPRFGCRVPSVLALVLAAILLVIGLNVSSPGLAVAVLSLCFGAVLFTDGIYWTAATYIGGSETAAVTGILNTGGTFSGIVSSLLIPTLAVRIGWPLALGSGTLFALAAAGLWFGVRSDRPFRPGESLAGTMPAEG